MSRILLASQNSIKIEETRLVFPEVGTLDLELLEVQHTDPAEVVRHKLAQVRALDLEVPVLVEDTGLAVDAWDGLPGALVKWFVGGLGPARLKELMATPGAPLGATATSAVGLVHRGDCEVWVGHLAGRLVDARGGLGGWTPIFEVGATGQTLGEMSLADRMHHTMRRAPLERARGWLTARGWTG
ncbi:hypothetical protein CFP65_4028 [Kitasatospora sp. MMS16-BH015]|uniref:non-canonical purine NTP pyrophosphatase n=1 Tax=Kitasatospora sp. MMS16-BH015 TaxID=2018025 RepID=UPI000CA27E7F|nr:non-canonical purine NTP pyrophosphatase [Kitasatospora sp. MMS16-BH015]AUG78795.1 hypothetical protein CFP65_4028 [Kitasatospora sp. MMS16-BH015]